MKQIFAICFVFLVGVSIAQDKIMLNNGEVVEAKVKRITKSKIIYLSHSYLDGPEYEIDKKSVSSIVFANGDKEEFATTSNLPFEVKNNVISFNYGDLMANRFSFNYERLVSKGKLGIKIPFGISYQNPNNYQSDKLIYYSGVDFNIYPVGQKKVTYFTGIGTRFGILNERVYSSIGYYNGYYYDSFTTSYIKKRLAIGFYMNNGITLHLIENMSITGVFGLGLRDVEGSTWARFSSIGELNVSIRF